jgi:hypothetical protein
MGRIWSIDAIAKNDSTSIYGSIIGLSESPLQEGLIFAGTDDGVISVTEDGGANWRRVDKFPGVPDMSYVEDLVASVHNPDVAYAVIDNHKRGDYRPYVLRTTGGAAGNRSAATCRPADRRIRSPRTMSMRISCSSAPSSGCSSPRTAAAAGTG